MRPWCTFPHFHFLSSYQTLGERTRRGDHFSPRGTGEKGYNKSFGFAVPVSKGKGTDGCGARRSVNSAALGAWQACSHLAGLVLMQQQWNHVKCSSTVRGVKRKRGSDCHELLLFTQELNVTVKICQNRKSAFWKILPSFFFFFWCQNGSCWIFRCWNNIA